MMDGSDVPSPSPDAPRDGRGRFLPGAPGRPLGSRNRASKLAARRILADFETHHAPFLAALRQFYVPQYVQLICRLLPRVNETGGVEVDAPLSEAEAAALLADARSAMDRIEAGQGTIADLEAALLGEGVRGGARGASATISPPIR